MNLAHRYVSIVGCVLVGLCGLAWMMHGITDETTSPTLHADILPARIPELHSRSTARTPDAEEETVTVVCMGDTHGLLPDVVPDGDVLIHTGDFSRFGNETDIELFNSFLGQLRHRHKLVVSGNHDPVRLGLKALPQHLSHATYLQDQAVVLDVGRNSKLTVFGSPWQPQFEGFETSASEQAIFLTLHPARIRM